MAVPFSSTKLRVPKGFQNILEGLAREVLRAQPENVYEFGASYFESLVKTRTGECLLCSLVCVLAMAMMVVLLFLSLFVLLI